MALAKFFTHIAGSTLDGTRLTKSDVMKYAVEISDIKDFSKAVMIGDREYDVLGAKEMGLSSIGVLYGFGSKEELEKQVQISLQPQLRISERFCWDDVVYY